jgi:hypothetical protein
MAKDKEFEKKYKEERLRRSQLRHQERRKKYTKKKVDSYYSRTWWQDGKLMQNCSYQGTCEYPCNGDC